MSEYPVNCPSVFFLHGEIVSTGQSKRKKEKSPDQHFKLVFHLLKCNKHLFAKCPEMHVEFCQIRPQFQHLYCTHTNHVFLQSRPLEAHFEPGKTQSYTYWFPVSSGLLSWTLPLTECTEETQTKDMFSICFSSGNNVIFLQRCAKVLSHP